MTDSAHPGGTYIELDGRPAVRFERTYPHPVDRVWRAVSDPAELPRWFPSRVEYEPRVGSTMRFSGDPHAEDVVGTLLAWDPPTASPSPGATTRCTWLSRRSMAAAAWCSSTCSPTRRPPP